MTGNTSTSKFRVSLPLMDSMVHSSTDRSRVGFGGRWPPLPTLISPTSHSPPESGPSDPLPVPRGETCSVTSRSVYVGAMNLLRTVRTPAIVYKRLNRFPPKGLTRVLSVDHWGDGDGLVQ